MTEPSEASEAAGREALATAVWCCYTYTDGKSNKFWKIRSNRRWMETWWGRIGTAGQKKIKWFPVDRQCATSAHGLQEHKVAKGYVRQADEPPVPSAPPRPPSSSASPAARPQVDPLAGIEAVAVAAQATGNAFGRLADAARSFNAGMIASPVLEAMREEEVRATNRARNFWEISVALPPAHPNARSSIRPAAAAIQNAIDAAGSLGIPVEDFVARRGFRTEGEIEETQMWGVSYQGRASVGLAREVRSGVSGACANSHQERAADATLRRLMAAGGGQESVRSEQGTDLGLMVVQRQGERVVPSSAPPPRFINLLATPPSDPKLESAAWHVLAQSDAERKLIMYWRLRFAGCLLETWSGRDLEERRFVVEERRRYASADDVVPDARGLVLTKLRAGYLPHQIHDPDAFLLDAARSDAQVYARVMAAMAEALKPRSSVALGRFYSLDEDEEI